MSRQLTFSANDGTALCLPADDSLSATLGDENTTPYPVGTQDIVQNYDLPAAAPVTFTAADATSNPLQGVSVGRGGGQLNQSLPDGTPVSLMWNGDDGCTTDASGQCTLAGLVGFPAGCNGTYSPPVGPSFTAYDCSGGDGDISAGSNALTLQFGDVNLITISGVVTQGGQPAPNVGVSLTNNTGTVSGVSTTTGSIATTAKSVK